MSGGVVQEGDEGRCTFKPSSTFKPNPRVCWYTGNRHTLFLMSLPHARLLPFLLLLPPPPPKHTHTHTTVLLLLPPSPSALPTAAGGPRSRGPLGVNKAAGWFNTLFPLKDLAGRKKVALMPPGVMEAVRKAISKATVDLTLDVSQGLWCAVVCSHPLGFVVGGACLQ